MTLYWSMAQNRPAAEGTAQAQAAARRAGTNVKELETRLDRTLLACEAMWTILRDRLGVTDQELVDRINEIDLSDGKLDGKVRKTAVTCPTCKRTIASRFPKCMYCGQPIIHDPFV